MGLDKLGEIIKSSKCPVCKKGAIKRRPSTSHLFMKRPQIEWQCENPKCEESTHWNVAGEHRKNLS